VKLASIQLVRFERTPIAAVEIIYSYIRPCSWRVNSIRIRTAQGFKINQQSRYDARGGFDMRFWRLVAKLWPGRKRNVHEGQSVRYIPRLAELTGPDECEDRTVQSAMCEIAPGIEYSTTAEVIRISVQTRSRQYFNEQSRIRRLSAVIVDYLLEHEWYWLLTGHYRPIAGPDGSRAAFDPIRTITATEATDHEHERTEFSGDGREG
jgi:hypothetical protein